MAKSYNQKQKVLYLMRLFLEETDENHTLSRKALEERLAGIGIHAERKSIYNDIETLKEFGLDIEYRKEAPEGYYLASHEFELAELKLLVDAVQASKFITERKSNVLIRKIEGLASRYEARELQRQVVVSNRIKSMNESIYYNVDKLQMALSSNVQITFQYFEWTVGKEMQLKRGGEKYVVSPWALTWDNENYYLISYEKESGKIKHFRVDKMLHIEMLDELREGKEVFERFDPAGYARKMFGMYGGVETTVRIRFPNRYIGVVIDRFGKDVPVRPDGEAHFIARVNVAVSEQFFGWLTGLGKGVIIVSPPEVREEYNQLLQSIAEQYED